MVGLCGVLQQDDGNDAIDDDTDNESEVNPRPQPRAIDKHQHDHDERWKHHAEAQGRGQCEVGRQDLGLEQTQNDVADDGADPSPPDLTQVMADPIILVVALDRRGRESQRPPRDVGAGENGFGCHRSCGFSGLKVSSPRDARVQEHATPTIDCL